MAGVRLADARLVPALPSFRPPALPRERELERYVVMCRQFAQDIAAHRGWKGDFPSPSSSEQAEAAAEAAAALEQQAQEPQ